MVILLSILLLLLLVYYGYITREGMSLKEEGDLIDILDEYDRVSITNSRTVPATDNTKNAENTLTAIVKLNITDQPFTDLIQGKGVYANTKAEGRLTLISNIINERISRNESKLDRTLFRKVLKEIEDTNENTNKKNSDKVLAAKSILVDNLKDPEFSYLNTPIADDRDDTKLLEELKRNINNIINNPKEKT